MKPEYEIECEKCNHPNMVSQEMAKEIHAQERLKVEEIEVRLRKGDLTKKEKKRLHKILTEMPFSEKMKGIPTVEELLYGGVKFYRRKGDRAQVFNPRTKRWTLINTKKGGIISHKKSKGPYKGVKKYKRKK